MNDDPIKLALDSLFARHRAINAEREIHRLEIEKLDFEDAKLQPKIVALVTALDEEIEPDSDLGKYLTDIVAVGLTDGVRAVLRANAPAWMAPPEIRNGLVRLGYELGRYTNVLASIHTILRRLRESREVTNGIRKPSRETVYRWTGNIKVEPQTAKLKLETFPSEVQIKPIEMIDKKGRPKKVIK